MARLKVSFFNVLVFFFLSFEGKEMERCGKSLS